MNRSTRNPIRTKAVGHKQREPRPAPRRQSTRQSAILVALSEG